VATVLWALCDEPLSFQHAALLSLATAASVLIVERKYRLIMSSYPVCVCPTPLNEFHSRVQIRWRLSGPPKRWYSTSLHCIGSRSVTLRNMCISHSVVITTA